MIVTPPPGRAGAAGPRSEGGSAEGALPAPRPAPALSMRTISGVNLCSNGRSKSVGRASGIAEQSAPSAGAAASQWSRPPIGEAATVRPSRVETTLETETLRPAAGCVSWDGTPIFAATPTVGERPLIGSIWLA